MRASRSPPNTIVEPMHARLFAGESRPIDPFTALTSFD